MKALIFVVGLLLSSSTLASALTVGDKVEVLHLSDQHERLLAVDSKTQILLFSRGMKGGEIIQQALEEKAGTMPDTWRYVADISGMPSLIAKFVAIPKMKDLAFAIGLDQEGEATRLLPGDKETATVIVLDKLTVLQVKQVASAQELLEATQH